MSKYRWIIYALFGFFNVIIWPTTFAKAMYGNTRDTSFVIVGHLPQKQSDYKKKYRTLAATYLTFSPDGNELLVNLGGEQIYLFDINRKRSALKFDTTHFAKSSIPVKGEKQVCYDKWRLLTVCQSFS